MAGVIHARLAGKDYGGDKHNRPQTLHPPTESFYGLPVKQGKGAGHRLWFPTVLCTFALLFAWRKAKMKPLHAFPVEINCPPIHKTDYMVSFYLQSYESGGTLELVEPDHGRSYQHRKPKGTR